MADEPKLTQADYDAADEVLERDRGDSRLYESRRELLAEFHAHLGRSTFRLYYGLRKPRGKYEELRLQSWEQKITLEEMAELMRARAERPVDQEMIEEGFTQLELRLKQYSLALQAAAEAVNPRRSPLKRASFERMATKHFVRTRRKFTLDRQELFTLHEYLDRARFEAGLGIAVAGEHSATNAMLLICLVMRNADKSWHSCLATAERSRTESRYLYEASAAELWRKVSASSYPRPQHLLTLLEQEQTAANVMLRKQEQQPSVMSGSAVAVHNATFEVHHAEFPNQHFSQQTPSKKKPSKEVQPLFLVKRWSEIVVGYDPKDGFWVLNQDLVPGEQFPKSKGKNFRLPESQLRTLLVGLASSETGNRLPMADLIKAWGLLDPGSQVQRDPRTRPGAIDEELKGELLDVLAAARAKVSDILKDAGRKFRGFVDGPTGKVDPCFRVVDLDVCSGFSVRCLCSTPERTFTFGPPRC